MLRPAGLSLVLAIGLGLAASTAGAAEVRFPLTVEYPLLQAALRKHLREESGGDIVLWRSADRCRSFVMRDPAVGPAQGRLRIAGPGSAEAGMGLLGYCFASVRWDGHVEIFVRPEIGRDWQLRLAVLDTQLYDANRRPSGVASRVWDAVRVWAEAQLPTFTFDLGPPVRDVKAALGLFAAPAAPGAEPGAGPLARALQSLRPVGVTLDPDDGVKVWVALDVPPPAPRAQAPEPALSADQVKRWEAVLDHWDGFLVFVTKDMGGVLPQPELRTELLDVLLTARHDLVAVLARGPEPGVDPVPELFVNAWSRLREIVRRAAALAGNETRALRYLTFLAAGDALAALRAAAPSLGFEMSADGLRRLARMLDPAYAGDPLEYSDLPDAALRNLFRFRDPDAPPRRERPRGSSSGTWLGPPVAPAADTDEWALLGLRLDRWSPQTNELLVYRDTVERLLTLAAERTFDPAEMNERFERLFHHLVKTTAWQESCWRQFTRRGGAVTYVLSGTNDVGLMQINVRVWRGFFSPEKLRWSASYNAGAGAEILYHLLRRYGVRETGERLENAARATYSAYNGGPARYRRYRLAQVPDLWRRIDRAFWEKYQLVAAGTARDRVLCEPIRAAAR